MATTLDPQEIAKFSALSASWWDAKGPFAGLHRMNPLRLGFVRERAAKHFGLSGVRPLSGLKAIDLGCGGGLVTLPLARLGAEVIGIDGSADAVGAARLQAQQVGLTARFEVGTAEQRAERHAESADLITALEIVEHVADVTAFLQAASALLKPNGLLIVSTINRTARARALALFAAENVLHMAPEGAHEFEKLVKPEEFSAATPELDWDEAVGMSFDPVGRTWKLSTDTSMNYLRAAVKPARR